MVLLVECQFVFCGLMIVEKKFCVFLKFVLKMSEVGDIDGLMSGFDQSCIDGLLSRLQIFVSLFRLLKVRYCLSVVCVMLLRWMLFDVIVCLRKKCFSRFVEVLNEIFDGVMMVVVFEFGLIVSVLVSELKFGILKWLIEQVRFKSRGSWLLFVRFFMLFVVSSFLVVSWLRLL